MSQDYLEIPMPYNEAPKSYLPNSLETKNLKKELARQRAACLDIPLVIDGQKIFDRPTENLCSPHDKNLVLAKVAQGTEDDARIAISSALKARSSWAALPWQERAGVFLKAASLITGKYRDRMNAATMLGQSKTCFQADIEAACELADFFRFNAYFAKKIHDEQPMYSPEGQWNRSVARPLEGFVYAISPFNFTAISLNLAAAPALMGNTVLWKPAPTAVLASYLGLEILEEAGLPAGVINMVTGDPVAISEAALGHQDLSGIHFTGSTKVFQHLWSEVGKRVSTYRTYPRMVGETGGKDFVFAHESADADSLTTALVRGAFEYQGQKCSAASRAYIPKKLWASMKEKLVTQAASIKMGDPEDFRNFMAAVIDEKSFEKIKSYIEFTRGANNAQIICGGEYNQSQGYFVRPTIIETTDPQYKTMQEEIFGPVLTVYPYDEDKLEETLDVCDSTSPYALTGAIFAKDRHMVQHLSNRLENSAGNFYINDKPTGAVVGQQPFGGARASGTNDKAGSVSNLQRWVSYRTIKENFVPITEYRYPHMGEE